MEFSKNKWKYSTIGLLAVLAAGFSFPQAFAHITNNIPHDLSHIFDAITALQSDVTVIKADTSNLPSDPASQFSTGQTKSLRGVIVNDPADGNAESFTILPQAFDKAYSGRIFIVMNTGTDEDNIVRLNCGVNVDLGGGSTGAVTRTIAEPDEFTVLPTGFVQKEFTCTGLNMTILDPAGTEDDPVDMWYVVQYVEGLDSSQVDSP